MNAGQLNTRVMIQRPVARDVPGKAGKVTEWQDVTSAWARREDGAGSENFNGSQLVADAAVMFRIRTQRGLSIDNTMRVVTDEAGGRQTFAIVQIRPSNDRASILLVTRAGVRSDN